MRPKSSLEEDSIIIALPSSAIEEPVPNLQATIAITQDQQEANLDLNKVRESEQRTAAWAIKRSIVSHQSNMGVIELSHDVGCKTLSSSAVKAGSNAEYLQPKKLLQQTNDKVALQSSYMCLCKNV